MVFFANHIYLIPIIVRIRQIGHVIIIHLKFWHVRSCFIIKIISIFIDGHNLIPIVCFECSRIGIIPFTQMLIRRVYIHIFLNSFQFSLRIFTDRNRSIILSIKVNVFSICFRRYHCAGFWNILWSKKYFNIVTFVWENSNYTIPFILCSCWIKPI